LDQFRFMISYNNVASSRQKMIVFQDNIVDAPLAYNLLFIKDIASPPKGESQ